MTSIESNDNKIQITDFVSLYIGNSENLCQKFTNKIDFVYMDPPYDTNRNFTLDSKNDTGFNDKWGPDEYENW